MIEFLLGLLLAISMNTLDVQGSHGRVAYELRWPCYEEVLAFDATPEICYLIRYKSGRLVTGP